jgi:MinD superfamily P-loop ATPase
MKQIVVLSGKGGTGKTSVVAAFAQLAFERPTPLRAVLADADVDAANLELVLCPQKLETNDFIGGSVAIIDTDLCQGCGLCEQICRFEAVLPPGKRNGLAYRVDPIACDGCAACVYQCPENAIHMQPQIVGSWYRSETPFGPLLHAELRPAQENSGKLVTLVKQQARLLGLDTGAELLIVDGPPGIGCPVISAAAGADLALIVTEPTIAAVHDMERMLELACNFRLPVLVCINKADIYLEGSKKIRDYCGQHHIDVVGSIPFDESVTQAMVQGEPVTAFAPGAPASLALVEIWQRVAMLINE